MKNKSEILKCIIFIIIGIIILQILTYILSPKFIEEQDPAAARIKSFYNEKENTLDVLFIGNSEASRAYSPICIWNEYGITSYNYSNSLQTTQMAYYKIKESLKYQHPKVIILEPNSFFESENSDEASRKVMDNWKFDDVKLSAIFDKNLEIKDRITYIFPIIKYHSRWNKMEATDFKVLKKKYNEIAYKGMPIIVNRKEYNGNKYYMAENGKEEKISENNLVYIKKIIELCKENNITILFNELPAPLIWSSAKNKATKEIADEYGLDFMDFNLLQEEIGIDWSQDFHDAGGHLNIYGAEKVSKYIGKILQEKYNLPNHKNDANIADEWNETAQKYEQHKKELETTISSKKDK